MAVNFQDLLKKPMDSVKKPAAKPAGTYFGVIKEYKFDESAKKKTPYCRVILHNISAGPDVQIEDTATHTAAEVTETIGKWNPGVDYYLTDDAIYRLKELIESCKIPTQGRGFDESIPELRGMPVQFEVTQRPSDDGETLYNDIGKVAGVE